MISVPVFIINATYFPSFMLSMSLLQVHKQSAMQEMGTIFLELLGPIFKINGVSGEERASYFNSAASFFFSYKTKLLLQ